MTFEAKYGGICGYDCENWIKPGDPVTYDEECGLVHEDCVPRTRRSAAICGTCHLVKPCECEDR